METLNFYYSAPKTEEYLEDYVYTHNLIGEKNIMLKSSKSGEVPAGEGFSFEPKPVYVGTQGPLSSYHSS